MPIMREERGRTLQALFSYRQTHQDEPGGRELHKLPAPSSRRI